MEDWILSPLERDDSLLSFLPTHYPHRVGLVEIWKKIDVIGKRLSAHAQQEQNTAGDQARVGANYEMSLRNSTDVVQNLSLELHDCIDQLRRFPPQFPYADHPSNSSSKGALHTIINEADEPESGEITRLPGAQRKNGEAFLPVPILSWRSSRESTEGTKMPDAVPKEHPLLDRNAVNGPAPTDRMTLQSIGVILTQTPSKGSTTTSVMTTPQLETRLPCPRSGADTFNSSAATESATTTGRAGASAALPSLLVGVNQPQSQRQSPSSPPAALMPFAFPPGSAASSLAPQPPITASLHTSPSAAFPGNEHNKGKSHPKPQQFIPSQNYVLLHAPQQPIAQAEQRIPSRTNTFTDGNEGHAHPLEVGFKSIPLPDMHHGVESNSVPLNKNPRLHTKDAAQRNALNWTFTSTTGPPSKKRGRIAADNTNMFCFHCGSTETPEWRRGPAGPKTLCNACGLQYAKKLKQANQRSKNEAPLSLILNSASGEDKDTSVTENWIVDGIEEEDL